MTLCTRCTMLGCVILACFSLIFSPVAGGAHPSERGNSPFYGLQIPVQEIVPDVYRHGPFINEIGEEEIVIRSVTKIRGSNGKGNGNGNGNNGNNGNGNGKPIDPTDPAAYCYALSPYGTWKTLQDWDIDYPSFDLVGVDVAEAVVLTEQGMLEWENASGATIFGDYQAQNSIYVGDLSFQNLSTNVAAMALVHYTMAKKPRRNWSPTHWQIILNRNFAWATDGDPLAMDYLSIVVHELGHVGGLLHPPTTPECREESMYPAAVRGEIKKRDIHVGDINGIRAKY